MEFVLRTIIQPFLLVFVFLFVFPEIGQSVGGSRAAAPTFATVLVPAVVGLSIMFQGVQSVALQLSQEFGFTREIEDRVQAPCPVWLVAISKVFAGVIQGLFAACIVFPIAAVIHAHGVHPHFDVKWWIVLTLLPLTCVAFSAMGLVLGLRLRAPQHRSHVRLHRPAPHLSRRHLLPVDPPVVGAGRRASGGCRSWCWSTLWST